MKWSKRQMMCNYQPQVVRVIVLQFIFLFFLYLFGDSSIHFILKATNKHLLLMLALILCRAQIKKQYSKQPHYYYGHVLGLGGFSSGSDSNCHHPTSSRVHQRELRLFFMLSLHEHAFNSFPFNSPYNSSCVSILSYQYRRVFNFTETLNPCSTANFIKKNFHFTRESPSHLRVSYRVAEKIYLFLLLFHFILFL